jgi:hypothetical protein
MRTNNAGDWLGCAEFAYELDVFKVCLKVCAPMSLSLRGLGMTHQCPLQNNVDL